MSASVTLGVLTLLAIFLGPIVALQLQRKIDEEREATARKLALFKTLMSYRATPLSPFFVQALNLIDVEFRAKNNKEQAVRDAWKVLLDHFGELANEPELRKKSQDLTVDLLTKMAESLGYHFDPVYLKKGAYYPLGLGNVEQEQQDIRRGIVDLLRGKAKLPVAVFEQRFPDVDTKG